MTVSEGKPAPMPTRRESLRSKIIAWSFVPTAIILAAVALLNIYAYQQVTEDLVLERDRDLIRLTAGQFANELREFAELLAVPARSPDIYLSTPTHQQAALRYHQERLAVFDGGVLVLNTAGMVVATLPAGSAVEGADWSRQAFFREMLRAPGTTYSGIMDETPVGGEGVAVAVPILGYQGEFMGALVGMFRCHPEASNALYGTLVKQRMGGSRSMYLVDGQGRLIYHREPERIGEWAAEGEVLAGVLAGETGTLRTRDARGMAILASYAPVPGTGWGLVAEESWDALLAASRSYRDFLLLLLLLGVLAPAIVVTVGVRRLTQPIADLIAGAQRLAAGEFDQRVEAPTGDELEELAHQFNDMAAQLQASYAELETRVQARTRELAALNAVAAAVSQSLDLSEILNAALETGLDVTGMDVGAAYRLDPDGETLTLAAVRGVAPTFEQRFGCLSIEHAPLLLRPAPQPGVVDVSTYPHEDLRQALLEEDIRFIITTPLAAKGRVHGMLNLGARQMRQVAPEELSLLAGVGQQVAVAMENARLYAQAEVAAAAAERSRLARELHDAVTQTLFSASLVAEVLPCLWERDPDEGRRRLEELRQLTRGALAEMRTLLLELRPSALQEAALGDLLAQLAESTIGRARLPVHVEMEGEGAPSVEVKVALYRIAQEALNNVAKHSGASCARVHLRQAPGAIDLCVSDDGRGFDPASVPPNHLGLGIMRERAEAIGAQLELESALGEGTRVSVRWRQDGA